MAYSENSKKVNLTKIQHEANEIIKKHCQENTAVSAGIKMALDILMLKLRETARLEGEEE